MAIKIFFLWTFILISRPQDYFPALDNYRIALISTVLALLVTIINQWHSVVKILSLKICKIYFLLFLVMIIGIPFALYRKVAFESVFFAYTINMIFFVLVINYINSVNKLKSILFVLLFCNLYYTVSSLIGGSFIEGRFISYGDMYDSNDTAYILIALLPMTMTFISLSNGFKKKILAVLTMATSILVIIFTGSRSGFISLLIFLVSFYMVFREKIKLSHIISFILLVMFIFSVYKDNINVGRYMTLKDIQSDYNVTDESGRVQIWDSGIQVFKSNFITGVGVNCFPEAIGNFRESGGKIPQWQTAHNSYLQIAAETGIFGIIFYIYMIIYSIKSLTIVRYMEKTANINPEINMVAGLLLIGMVSIMVDAFFLSQAYSLFITLYFAMCGALKNIYGNIVLENNDLPIIIKSDKGPNGNYIVQTLSQDSDLPATSIVLGVNENH